MLGFSDDRQNSDFVGQSLPIPSQKMPSLPPLSPLVTPSKTRPTYPHLQASSFSRSSSPSTKYGLNKTPVGLNSNIPFQVHFFNSLFIRNRLHLDRKEHFSIFSFNGNSKQSNQNTLSTSSSFSIYSFFSDNSN